MDNTTKLKPIKILSNFQLRWVAACGIGELLGISVAALIAVIATNVFSDATELIDKLFYLLLMLCAGALEGLILGYFQWYVLREKIGALDKSDWIRYTMNAGIAGWCIGMLFSIFIIDTSDTIIMADEPSPFLMYGFAVLLGIFLGALFGLFQSIPLRLYAKNSSLWIKANALAWGVAMFWIFVAASIPDETTPVLFILLYAIMGGLLAGTSLGLVTAYFIPKLKPIYE